MSVNKDNQTYKKTSFLSGVNSDFIQEYYALYLENPKLLTKDWIEFFNGLNEDSKNILQNVKGPSWNPKKIRQINIDQRILATRDEEEISEIGYLAIDTETNSIKPFFSKIFVDFINPLTNSVISLLTNILND